MGGLPATHAADPRAVEDLAWRRWAFAPVGAVTISVAGAACSKTSPTDGLVENGQSNSSTARLL